MQHAYPIMRAACLLFGLGAAQAAAQTSAPPAGQAADPAAAVPATTYQAAIGYRPETAPDAPPDQRWAASNATVAAYNSMSLTMKGMKGHGAVAPTAPADPPANHAGHAGHDDAPAQPAQQQHMQHQPQHHKESP